MTPPSRPSAARRLNGLLQQSSEPIFLLDRRRRLSFVNRAWEELTGHPIETVMGLVCGARRGPDPHPLAELAESFAPPPEVVVGRPASVSSLVVHHGGERHWRRIDFSPILDRDGALIGTLGWVREGNAASPTSESDSLRLRAELGRLRDRLRDRHGFDTLIGQGPAHRRLLDQLNAAAATSVPVLIVGEPGTGRRLAARTIHQRSDRAQTALLMFDCAALPPEILERELFRGAERGQAEALATPRDVTILLTDILELPRDLQVRLAETLDGRSRLIATSAIDPEQARRQDRLRPEMYYALTTLIVRLSPLRERMEEVPLLAQHFLERVNARSDRRLAGFDAEALRHLAAHDWPGNLRELSRAIDAAHAQAAGDLIRGTDLPAAVRGPLGAAYPPPPMPSPIRPLDERLNQVERRLIEQALHHARHNKSRAAELLEISRPRLYRRIKELNIPDISESHDDEDRATELRTSLPASP